MIPKLRQLLPLLLAVLLLFGCQRAPETDAEWKIYRYAQEHDIPYAAYPESLIDLLERNPETEAFVLQYPLAKDLQKDVDISEYSNSEAVPLFMQWDPRWGYLTYGADVAGLTGCGPVCLSMVAYHLTKDPAFSPDRMIRFASENGYCVKGSGSSWTLISEGGKKLGFAVRELPLDENVIRKHLQEGVPIIIVVGPGDFTTTGHFMVMVGWENGSIRINDPNSAANSEKLWRYEDIKDQIRNLWAIRAA